MDDNMTTWLKILSMQISQVCQLCQQSPRLFTNHAAQLHTLLVSIFTLCVKQLAEFSIGFNKTALLCLAVTLLEGEDALSFLQGLYCISVNCMDNAEAQFTTALRVSKWWWKKTFSFLLLFSSIAWDVFGILFQLTTHQELWTYIVTNLASVYIREGNRHQEVSISYTAVHYFIE